MSARSPLGVGVVGLGFMGQTHIAAYRDACAAGLANRLVAVCDQSPEKRGGQLATAGNLVRAPNERVELAPGQVDAFADPAELIAHAEVDAVSICTPTDTHVDLAIAALEAEKHVLVEKPVAIDSRQVERLATALRGAETLCLPAMCMRFWPGWDWLHERVQDGQLGAVKSATFRRLGSPPQWGLEFYGDATRSGGALFDLHVHDADFVRWCFGDPAEVVATGTLDHLTTLYRYPDGPPHVTVEGGWDHTPGLDFRMVFTVVFEGATADYDPRREPHLWLARDGRQERIETSELSGYDLEIRHFLRAIAGTETPRATVDEALGLTRLLEAERASLESGRPVAL